MDNNSQYLLLTHLGPTVSQFCLLMQKQSNVQMEKTSLKVQHPEKKKQRIGNFVNYIKHFSCIWSTSSNLVSPKMYKISHNDVLRMTKIVNKTSKGTAGSRFASAVNFFMIVERKQNLLRENNHFWYVSSLFSKVRLEFARGGGTPI